MRNCRTEDRVELLSGWGRYEPVRSAVVRPASPDDVRTVIREASYPSLIARGEGRSYGDSAVNDDGAVVRQRALNRIRSFDAETGVLDCEAGLTIAEIIDLFLPRGFFPAVTPGTKHVTIGGAIAADVHGKNHHVDGTFSRCVESFDMMTADGTVVQCSRGEGSEIFWATVGGMGLTGIILSVRLRLMPISTSHLEVEVERGKDLDAVLDRFDSEPQGTKYSVAWLDCLARGRRLGRSILMRGRHAEPSDLPRRLRRVPLAVAQGAGWNVPFDFPGFALGRWSVALFNATYYRIPRPKRELVGYEPFFYPLDRIANWNRIYGRRGFVQYQALFPPSTSREGMVELLETISSARMGSFLSVFKKTGARGDGLLSFPKEGHTVALDLPNTGERLRRLVRRLDDIVLRHGGRLYLAKDALMDRRTFDAMYENADTFRAVKRRMDPEGLFMSRQARRLGLGA